MYCMHCGRATEPGINYCPHCGKRLASEADAKALTPPVAPHASGATQPQLPRACTKCHIDLESDILFCPRCGTKNYLPQPNKSRKGELLMELDNCSLIKLQIMKNPGAILIYDDKLCFRATTAANNVVIPYTDLASAAPQGGISYKYGIKLSSVGGKVYPFSLPECYADIISYVISLLLDYKQ